jgi:AraC family transcriptional regulator
VDVAAHGHEEAHLVLVLDGLYVTSARGPAPLQMGGGLIYNPPGTWHRDRFESVRGRVAGRFLALSLGNDRLREATEVGTLPGEPIVVLDRAAVGLAIRLARVCQVRETPCAELDGITVDLLAVIGRLAGTAPRAHPPWLAQARAHLADRCEEPVTIREVAASVGVHPVYLARAFRRRFGLTPMDYLRERRVGRAAALLGATMLPLTEVAARSGFCDQSHLARQFQRAFGIAPGRFRAERARSGRTGNAGGLPLERAGSLRPGRTFR